MKRRKKDKATPGAGKGAAAVLTDWQIVFDTMLDPVAIMDTDGAIRLCNRAFAALVGLDPETARGRRCHSLVHRSGSIPPNCPIHLLVTDVVLPEMNGKELKELLQQIRPDTKVLYMSGYTPNVIVHRGMLEEGINFLPKPFSIKALADKVRKALEKT